MIEGNGHEPLRLNIGSGASLILKGYVNVDAKFGDMAYPLKYDDGTVDEIYASHILEHFPQRQTLDVLRDWARALKPGGVLKVAVPDFEFIAKQHFAGNPNLLPLASYLMGGQQDENDFHKAIFDQPGLRDLLVAAGLEDIQPWMSEVKDCAALPVSLNLMGRKPQTVHSPLREMAEAQRQAIKGNGAKNQDVKPLAEQPNTPYKAFVASIKSENQYSQFSEESAIKAIFERIGVTNKWCCEVGAGDGLFFSNTRKLIESGWQAVLIEADDEKFERLRKLYDPDGGAVRAKLLNSPGTLLSTPQFALWHCRVSSEGEGSLDSILKRSYAPQDIDLLVIDVDGPDYYLLNSLVEFKPRVLIVEFDPEADLDYIPEPGAPLYDQAGLKVIGQCAQSRGYEAICRTQVNLICVRRDLAHLLTQQIEQPVGRHFVEGQWRQQTELSSSKVRVRAAVVMSTPRYGPLDAAEAISEICTHIHAPRFKSGGAFWEQGLTRSIELAIDYKDNDGEPIDVIVSMDYDTFATPDDAKKLIQLLYQNPQYDCIVPLQSRRGVFTEILATAAGPVDMTNGLAPIVTGHFGLTVFRRRVFETLKKPWLLGKTDPSGGWGDGRTDADIHFWQNFNDCGLKAALAPGVVIGHGEDAVVYPRLVNGRIEKVYISVYEWLGERSVPENAGVIA